MKCDIRHLPGPDWKYIPATKAGFADQVQSPENARFLYVNQRLVAILCPAGQYMIWPYYWTINNTVACIHDLSENEIWTELGPYEWQQDYREKMIDAGYVPVEKDGKTCYI